MRPDAQPQHGKERMTARKIMLIEDDDIVAGLVRFLVERQGHELEWLNTGADAVEAVTRLAPDALILDVLLPHQDGFAILSKLRAQPETARLPVLMLTGKSREQDIVQALELGANDHLAKPFQPAELTARLQRLLPGR